VTRKSVRHHEDDVSRSKIVDEVGDRGLPEAPRSKAARPSHEVLEMAPPWRANRPRGDDDATPEGVGNPVPGHVEVAEMHG